MLSVFQGLSGQVTGNGNPASRHEAAIKHNNDVLLKMIVQEWNLCSRLDTKV